MPDLILASGSVTRAQILRGAGLTFTAMNPDIDEEAVKVVVRQQTSDVEGQAKALALSKALSLSFQHDGYIIGADQMLSLDGAAFDKPKDRAEARAHLLALRGRTHELVTAISVAVNGKMVWQHVATPRLTMRAFSDDFVDWYLANAGEGVLTSVGAYQLEGLGAHLFEKVEGDYFSVLGLPLLPLLDFLRTQGVAPK